MISKEDVDPLKGKDIFMIKEKNKKMCFDLRWKKRPSIKIKKCKFFLILEKSKKCQERMG